MTNLWSSPAWTVVATASQVIAAFAVAWAAYEAKISAHSARDSVSEAKRSADLLEANMRLSQRAWLGIESIKTLQTINPNIRPVFVIGLKNTGLTPALNACMSLHVVLTATEISEEEMRAYDREEEASLSFPPGMSQIAYGQLPARAALAPVELTALRAGDAFLYGIGRIRYDDIFGGEHITEWAFRYDSNAPTEFVIIPFHNRMT